MTLLGTATSELTHQAASDEGSTPPLVAGVAGTVFAGAIFGFFYAWVCSTMWGLDDADPRVAIAAMQAMNASVRNVVFLPAFFFTPFVLALASGLSYRDRAKKSAVLYGAASLIYLFGGLILTRAVNVPMNRDLADVVIPESIQAAEQVWNDYSATWQRWNITRTVFSGSSLVLAALGLANRNHRTAEAVEG